VVASLVTRGKSMAGGPLQAADDMVRIISNGMTFGAADHIASALGEQDTAAKTAAARQRAGFAGDLGSVLGLAGDLKLAGMGVRALPKIAGAVFSKKGLAAAGLGIGSLAEYNARTADAAPAKAAGVTPVAKPKKANVDDMVAKIAAAVHGPATAKPAGPASYDDMVTRLAAGQDGMISLRQLGALSESAQRGAQADYYQHGGASRPVAPGDTAGHMLEQMYVNQFQKALTDPKADPAKAQEEFENKVLQLRKTQFIDPYGLHDGGE
jgi:hypothetical protein